MAATEVVRGLFRIPLAFVDVYALVGGDSVTLIDSGFPGRHERVLAALARRGYRRFGTGQGHPTRRCASAPG